MPDVESPMEGTHESAHEGPISPDYIFQTISDATNRIGDSKYLAEEGDQPEPKKQVTKAPAKPEVQQPGDELELPDEEPEKEEEEAPPEEEGDQQEEGDVAKRNTKWNTYRKAYKENPRLRAEVANLKRQVEELKTGAGSEATTLKQRLEELNQEREGLLRAVEIGSVEHSPRWHQEIVQPLDRIWGNIQAIAKRNSLDPNKLAALVANNDDVALDEYIAEARPGDKSHLFAMLPVVQNIDEHKKFLHANARQISQSDYQAAMQQREQQLSGVKQQRTGAIERIMPKLDEKILRFFPKDKRPNLAAARDNILDFEHWKEDVKMYGGLAAYVLPDVLEQWKATRIALREARDQLVKLRGGTPKSTAGSKAPGRTAPINGDEDEDLNRPIREITGDMTTRLRRAMGYR